MAVSKAKQAATLRYRAKAYDHVSFDVPKGMSAEYTAAAAKIGIGKMEMIRRAIAEFIARHGGADGGEGTSTKTDSAAQIAEPGEKSTCGEGIPIIYSERTAAAQNQPVSTNVQTIQATAVDASQRITGNEKSILDAVNALTPESQKALLKFLQSLTG